MKLQFITDLEIVKTIKQCTWTEMAEYLNIDYSTLSRWRSGKSAPNEKTIRNIYDAIYKNGIRINKLLEESYKDSENEESKVLFHGSKDGISGPLSISFSNDKKDFGKGFYLGESVEQAVSFVSTYKNSKLYFVRIKNIGSLKIKTFDVSKEWMILVAYFRGRIEEYKDSKYLKSLLASIDGIDIIVAPIADNSMYSIINEFIEGSITDLQCINSLSANRLGKQYVILNDNVLKNNVEIIRESCLCDLEKEDYLKAKEEDKNIGKSKMILAKRQYAGKGLYIEEVLK
ncbi:MAG: DUF3990 domain-containing protein [Bacilli bacterium]|nr:DUF3990 domain-containing protein [Bacilli bacterium]